MTWDLRAARGDYCCYFNKWNICVENDSKGTKCATRLFQYSCDPATVWMKNARSSLTRSKDQECQRWRDLSFSAIACVLILLPNIPTVAISIESSRIRLLIAEQVYHLSCMHAMRINSRFSMKLLSLLLNCFASKFFFKYPFSSMETDYLFLKGTNI